MKLEPRPLLTLAIPTYNRSRYLTELLDCLLPQFAKVDEVELLISDNASPDDTQSVVAAFEARGLSSRYIRNRENIGADANFLQCLNLARGKYVWVMGDDDLLAPDALSLLLATLAGTKQEYDLIYLASVGFTGHERPLVTRDPLKRFAEEVTDGRYFLNKVNALIGLISANIVNKDRLLATPHPPIEALSDTNLIQVGWLFPVLHCRCHVLYVFERLLYYRHFNSGGWGICEVFGLRLHTIAQRYFAEEPDLARSLMNGVLRFWLPDVLMDMRKGKQQSMNSEDFAQTLSPIFRDNWRFWVFVYSIAVPPLPLARCIHRLNRMVNRFTRIWEGSIRHFVGKSGIQRPF